MIAPLAGAVAGAMTGLTHAVVYLAAYTASSDPSLASTGNPVILIISVVGAWIVGLVTGGLSGGIVGAGLAVTWAMGISPTWRVMAVSALACAGTVWALLGWTTGDAQSVVLALQSALAIVGGVILLDTYAGSRATHVSASVGAGEM